MTDSTCTVLSLSSMASSILPVGNHKVFQMYLPGHAQIIQNLAAQPENLSSGSMLYITAWFQNGHFHFRLWLLRYCLLVITKYSKCIYLDMLK